MHKILFLLLCTLTLSACSSLGVKPWERGNLAKPEMTFSSNLIDDTNDHIYFSKEATSGGRSIAAGGCGCN